MKYSNLHTSLKICFHKSLKAEICFYLFLVFDNFSIFKEYIICIIFDLNYWMSD